MPKFALFLLACAGLVILACTTPTPTDLPPPTPTPTPNVEATVAAGIAGTREAEAAIEATIEASVAATLTPPQPTATPYPTNTPYPTATATLRPTPTLRRTPTPRPTATPRPTSTPRPTPTPRPTLTAAQLASPLGRYAAEHAGGPGAIYTGDGDWESLSGPATYYEFADIFGANLGDEDGYVPLYAIEQHQWIFESDYYHELIRKARLTSPTPLTTQGESITLQYTCIDQILLWWCRHLESYFASNVLERTNGQIEVEIISFRELGWDGSDTMALLADGTLPMTEIFVNYVGWEFPILPVQYLWGIWYDHQTHYAALTNLFADITQVVEDETGAQVLFHNWIAGLGDLFIFSNHRIEHPDDFADLKIRSQSVEFSAYVGHIGGQPRAMAYSQVHTALERGIIDAAVDGADSIYDRYHEVTDYMNGPIYSFRSTTNAVNGDVWGDIPADLQQILIEEGAKHELEALRLAAIQNLIAVQRNIDAGLELVEFGPEMRQASFEAARDSVVPNWLRRIGYPDEGQDTVAVFNDKVGPVVGLRVEPDGSVVEVLITQGPHAGKTAAEVLGRR